MAKMAKVKARISGNVVEFWKYENPIFLEGNSSGGRKKKDVPKSEKADEYKKQNSRKSKDKFMALVRSNFDDGDKFITLTFRDTDKFDIRNVEHTNKQFKTFMQRLRYKYGSFPYIGVIEFQDENKRGAVHYHLIAKLGYVKSEILAGIWGHGFIGINRIQGVDNIGAYISKYMQKDMGDSRLNGKKNYLPSRGLKKPTVLYGKVAQDLLESYEGIKKEAFRDCYDSEHFGMINYKEYNLNRETKQTKLGNNIKEIERIHTEKENMDSLLYKDFQTLTEKIEKVSEGLENGQISIDTRILDDVTRREKKSVFRNGNWFKYVEESLLKYDNDGTIRNTEKNDKLVSDSRDYGLMYQLNMDWFIDGN